MKLTVHNLFHRNTASTLWEDSAAKNCHSKRNFIIAWESGGGHAAAAVSLNIEAGASVAFNLGPAAAAWKTRSTRLAAEFTIEAAESALTRAAAAIFCSVKATVCATESTAERYSLFIDSIITSHVCCYVVILIRTPSTSSSNRALDLVRENQLTRNKKNQARKMSIALKLSTNSYVES